MYTNVGIPVVRFREQATVVQVDIIATNTTFNISRTMLSSYHAFLPKEVRGFGLYEMRHVASHISSRSGALFFPPILV